MLLNPFPLTDLRPEVEFMHLLRMHRHIFMFETGSIGQTPSLLKHYLVIVIIIVFIIIINKLSSGVKK